MVQHKPAKPAARVVTRMVVDFVLRGIRAATRHLDGDLMGALVFLVLLQARHTRTAPKPLASAAPESADVGCGARPISVYSLAQSLKTPPETMRRCVGRLIERGWCVRVGAKGVVVSDEAAARVQMDRLMGDIRIAFWHMLADLKNIGFDFDLFDRATAQTDIVHVEMDAFPVTARSTRPVRDPSDPVLERVVIDFVLRFIETGVAAHANDYVRSCVFVAITSANSSPVTYDPDLAWRYATHDTPPPDNARRAASLAEVSHILAMPYETIRRYVNALIELGLCARDERKGLMIPMSVLQSPQAIAVGTEITLRFAQMIGELKRLGLDFRGTDFASLLRPQAPGKLASSI